MDKQLKKGTIASELIIVAREMKGKRPTELNFDEMIDVVEEVINKISAYPILANNSFCDCSMEGSQHRKDYAGKHCPICGNMVAK